MKGRIIDDSITKIMEGWLVLMYRKSDLRAASRVGRSSYEVKGRRDLMEDTAAVNSSVSKELK